jgi:hypothetical protein
MNGIWGPAGIIIGAFIAAYFYVKTRRVKRLVFMQRCTEVIPEATYVEDLQILYKSDPIKRLSVTDLIIWSQSNETVNKEDIVSEDPIQIVNPTDVNLFSSKLIRREPEVSKFDIDHIALRVGSPTYTKASVVLKFAYLDNRFGTWIRLYHDGRQSTRFRILGRLKGQTKPIEECLEWMQKRRTFVSRTQQVFSAILSLGSLLFFMTVVIFLPFPIWQSIIDNKYDNLVAPLIAEALFVFIIIRFRYELPRNIRQVWNQLRWSISPINVPRELAEKNQNGSETT